MNKGEELFNKIKDKVMQYYFDIENNNTLSREQKISKIIFFSSAICAGAAAQPIPFADIYILTPLQILMGTRIASVYGISISKQNMKEVIKQLAGIVGLGIAAQQTALGLYKMGLPFFAGITTIPLVFGLTYAIGSIINLYFRAKSENRDLTNDEIKQAWERFKKQGKETAKKSKKEIKEFIKSIFGK